MFISQQLLPLEPSGFLWHETTADTSCHKAKYIPEHALYPQRKKTKRKDGAPLESIPPCMSVTQEKQVRNVCCISESSRCSFTTNTIHVPSLYDRMSNQKIVLLLHFIRVNNSFTFDIIGSLTASTLSFIRRENEKALFGVTLKTFCLCGALRVNNKNRSRLNVRVICCAAGLESAILGSVLLQHL